MAAAQAMPATTTPLGHEVLAMLEPLAAALGQPRVRALHLPPPRADGSRRGEFAALELDDGSVGLAYVLLDDTLARLRGAGGAEAGAPGGPGDAGALAGRPALEVARAMAGAPGATRTLGWAAAQALAASLARRARWAPPPAADSIAGLAPGPGDHVGLVGLFGPLMPQLIASGARITVVELRAELAGRHEGYEVTLDPAALAACNKVIATGALLINDTLDAVLAHTGGAERVALLGPSVGGGLPDALFARGVHILGGTWIDDPAAFVHALAAGEETRGASRKFTLAREQWPGWRALLAQAGRRSG